MTDHSPKLLKVSEYIGKCNRYFLEYTNRECINMVLFGAISI
uniref:Uncharacterized protein n=1 Tax=Lepeophtheirus salmonis TaxID=72036 RepID=A0A0K2TNY5_LEPSM